MKSGHHARMGLTGVIAGAVCTAAAAAEPQLAAWTVASGGGGMIDGRGLTLAFTIGQCDATPTMLATGSYELCGGYWPSFAAETCAADYNGDGGIDFFDYLDFVNDFSSGGIRADFNSDASIDFFDYLDFVNAFLLGC